MIDMLAQPAFASREARIAHYEDVLAFLAPIFATRSRADWCARLTELEVPNAAVATSAEVLASPQALSFDGQRALAVTAPPLLGADNDAILGPQDRAAAR